MNQNEKGLTPLFCYPQFLKGATKLRQFKCNSVLSAVCLLLISLEAFAGEIALTFDDAPMGNSALMSATERTQRLLSALQTAEVDDVLFFVNTDKFTPASQQRLKQYVAAGFHLANHSHSHGNASKMSVEAYIADVEKAQHLLAPYDNVLPFHRFPYLNHGRDLAHITQLQNRLNALGLKPGYVTVDNFDFYINHLMNEAKSRGAGIDMVKAEALYVDILWQSVVFYDDIAKRVLGRSPKHVLLLHENDAAALFVGALIAKIRSEGWRIISPREAYTDPIADKFPEVTYLGQGRVAALAYARGMQESELKNISANELFLQSLFRNQNVFTVSQ